MRYLLIFIFGASLLSAQNLDSLFNSLVSMQNSEGQIKYQRSTTANIKPIKCGFGIIADIKLHFNEFTSEQQNKIQEILSRPKKQTSIVSPSGIFRIHFDTTGAETPDYFNGIENTIQLSVDSLAIAFDSSYNYEINVLGYNPPPNDEGAGGDDLYDVYIENAGAYGWTTPVSLGPTYIVVDNKMNFYTEGINAARVTAAHEYHHAIQLGSYSADTDENTYYFELTSTSMEEFVYDSVNDYYGYLWSYFRNPDKRFTDLNGYNVAIWNIFLKEYFEQEEGNNKKGFDLIKRSWELMRDNKRTAIESINMALVESGMSIKTMFSEFGIWCYFTDNRTKTYKYFSEAINYPLIRPLAIYNYTPPKETYMMIAEGVANNYVIFDLDSTGVNDILVSIVTNHDVISASGFPYNEIDYEYSLMTSNEYGENEIIDGYYSIIESEDRQYLIESNIFNNEVVNRGVVSEKNDFAYPQPFYYSKHSFVFFPTKQSQYGMAKLTIYSTSMNLIYSDNRQIYNNENIVIRWDGKDNNGNKAPSGIYIYVTESDGTIIKGKLAIINN